MAHNLVKNLACPIMTTNKHSLALVGKAIQWLQDTSHHVKSLDDQSTYMLESCCLVFYCMLNFASFKNINIVKIKFRLKYFKSRYA